MTQTAADPFENPGTSEFVDWKDVNGSLIVLEVEEYIPDFETVHGKSNAIKADMHVLDGDLEGETYEGTLIFGRSMVPQLKKRVGKMVLARVGQGSKQKGKNAPWLLNEPTADDRKAALEWHESRKADPFDTADDSDD